MQILLGVWDGRESKPLRFTEIKNATGWNSRKTTDMLKIAVKEGYVDKYVVNRAALYRSRLTDYRGYFDALMFLKRVDSVNRKQGMILSTEAPLSLFLSYHVLAYGIPPSRQLSALEEEMLSSILSRMSAAFNDYAHLCTAVKERQQFEEGSPLPSSVKRNMFARDVDDALGSLSVAAAHQIYGDLLWEHIFFKLMHDVRFALEKGSLDLTGPIELLNCSPYLAKLALELAKEIRTGGLSDYSDPDPETTERLFSFNRTVDPFEETTKDIAVVITPSPQAMEEFACQVGKIVADEYDVWKTPDVMEESITTRSEILWDDVFEFSDGKTYTRRDLLRESICNTLASLRYGPEGPFAESDRKFMKKDRNLSEVFSLEEITAMISTVEDIIRRTKKFYDMIDKGEVLDTIQRDPEWFSDEELHAFHLAQHVANSARWTKKFGKDITDCFELPGRSKEIDKLATEYQSRVEEELARRQFTNGTPRNRGPGKKKMRRSKKDIETRKS